MCRVYLLKYWNSEASESPIPSSMYSSYIYNVADYIDANMYMLTTMCAIAIRDVGDTSQHRFKKFFSTIVLVQPLMTAGGLYSADDFYVLDSKLVVMETTIDNYNKSLYLGSSKIHDIMSHICISIENNPDLMHLWPFLMSLMYGPSSLANKSRTKKPSQIATNLFYL